MQEKIFLSYIKLEALFETLEETFTREFNKENKEKKYIFLKKLLRNLSTKKAMNIIDIDSLSIENANKLIEENDSILVIYLKKVQDEGRIICINFDNTKEVEKLINEIVKRMNINNE